MNGKIETALNDQINADSYSAYLFLSMSAYLEDVNLPGAANWMKIQGQEELTHVMKFFDYINERRGHVDLYAIAEPPKSWDSVLDLFIAAFEHEQIVSGRINDLVALSKDEKDFATYNFLQWFVDEQVEEEASVDAVVQKLKLIDGHGAGMFMIDQELGTRVFTPPTAAA